MQLRLEDKQGVEWNLSNVRPETERQQRALHQIPFQISGGQLDAVRFPAPVQESRRLHSVRQYRQLATVSYSQRPARESNKIVPRGSLCEKIVKAACALITAKDKV